MNLNVDMTAEELQACLKGDFRDPTSIDRAIVGVPMFMFTLIGLHLNITLWRIISMHKDFIDRNFKRHVVSLICSSIEGTGFNLTGLLTLCPIVAFGIQWPDTLLITISTPDTLFYQVYQHFSGKKHFIFVLSPWLLAGWIIGHSTYLGCYTRFNRYQLRFQYGCSDCPFYFDLLAYFATYLPVAFFAMYFCIFASILRKKFSAGGKFSIKKQKKDLLFVIQFTIITIFQVCASQFFYVIGGITSDVILASLLMLSASCLNTYTNPIVMFVFQERARKSFTAWSKRLWLFSSDLKSLVDTTPPVFVASQVPSGMRSTIASTASPLRR